MADVEDPCDREALRSGLILQWRKRRREKPARGASFSEMSEMPPLKEIYTPPPPPPAATEFEAEPAVSVEPDAPSEKSQSAAAGSRAQGGHRN